MAPVGLEVEIGAPASGLRGQSVWLEGLSPWAHCSLCILAEATALQLKAGRWSVRSKGKSSSHSGR